MSTDVKDIKFLNGASLRQYYENSRNNIEDPIFTGFTLDIDKLHSPLFYALAGDEYMEAESLRSPDGTNTSLAAKIEQKLAYVNKYNIVASPDSYEINTLDAKSSLGSDSRRKAGYGLQDKYYIDNVLYGAVDYIYMVDKVTESMYTDDYGVTDLGSGTPSSSIYETYSNKLKDSGIPIDLIGDKTVTYTNPNTGETVTLQSTEYDDVAAAIWDKVKEKEGGISQEVKDQHDQNISDAEEKKNIYDSLTNEDSDYYKLTKELKEMEAGIAAQETDVLSEFNDILTMMERNRALFSGNGDKDEIREKIDKVYEQYVIFTQYFIDRRSYDQVYTNKYGFITVTFNIPKEDAIDREVGNMKDVTDADKPYYVKIMTVLRSSISERKVNEVTAQKRIELKEEIEKLQKKIYGVHTDGRLGSETDPAPGSACYDYRTAANKAGTDDFTKANHELNDWKNIQANLDDLQEYNDISSIKNKVQRNLPSLDITQFEGESSKDYSARVNELRNTRTTKFEVPQTVYDMLGFIRGMDDLTKKYPYMLQSISGLDEAYKKYFDLKDPYMGSGDGKITIQCLEFIDLRVTSMFNKYFNAVYDRQYKRERVPINLRRFNCSVFVHDIRNFKNTFEGSVVANIGDLATITEMALNYVSAVEFKFYDCEIVPEETGSIFDNVTNVPSNEMRGTTFTFTYGNCIINFLPFEDVRKYVLDKKENKDIKPGVVKDVYKNENFQEDYLKVNETPVINNRKAVTSTMEEVDDGNFRRWFDRSELGNVNNNDYREYIRHDSAVAVDDYYKTTIVNDFAMGSVAAKNKELTAMDDALRKIVVGISASTGIPVKGVTDALNIQFIDPILTQQDLDTPVIKKIGNVNNSKVVDIDTMEYIGTVDGEDKEEEKEAKDLGNVNDTKK